MNKFKTVWDKTNIGENYPGITSPLTYSFIRNAYCNVYENFVRLVGIDTKTIENNKVIFENMLGYIQGEVFYNINNWYEMVKLLPGYRYNKEFFENMLSPAVNKKETIKQKFSAQFLWNNKKTIARFLSLIIFIKPLYRKFDREFQANFQLYNTLNFNSLDNFQLIAVFEKLQERFFSTWAYTIVNDFRVMIFYGILTKFVKKHFPKKSNEILSSIYGVKNKPESIKPLKELIKIAMDIKSTSQHAELFKKETSFILSKLNESQFQSLKKQIDGYINSFGERAFNELKLEDVNFKEQPESLIAVIKQYTLYVQSDLESVEIMVNTSKTKKANQHVNNLNLVNKIIFNYLADTSRQSIYKREEYRFKRAKVFNIAKSFFNEIAKRLIESGDLEKPNDIFYLYVNEVFDYLRFHRINEDSRQIILNRIKTLKYYEDHPLPRRIRTQGLPSHAVITGELPKQNNELIGNPTSRGMVNNAEVVVMPKLDLTTNVKGKILITESTDPGWTVLFPLIKGIIIEKGGALSHASIVARELGIPCLILQDATKTFHTGNIIKLDAVKGTVKLY